MTQANSIDALDPEAARNGRHVPLPVSFLALITRKFTHRRFIRVSNEGN